LPRTILIGSDHAGFKLKKVLEHYLLRLGYAVEDVGTYTQQSCDYPDFAADLASEISRDKFKRGILICKSGIGNSIVANRFPGVRAALCASIKAARLSRKDNDSNVLAMGAGFVSESLAKRILKEWLNTGFEGGRHQRRLNKIEKIERGLKIKG